MEKKHVTLANGLRIPTIGEGTFPQKEELILSVKAAYEIGYRLFDTSDNYFNEQYYGVGLSELDYNEDIITITKFSSPFENWEETFQKSISNIYVNKKVGKLIYLLHWPYPYLMDKIWHWMEDLYMEGKCDAIGVCNFEVKHLEKLIIGCRIIPMINQFECHPLFQQNGVEEYCRNNGIKVMSYSPFARMDKILMGSSVLKRISEKYNKSTTQIIIAWNIARGRIVIPGASQKTHLIKNYDALNIKLQEDDLIQIDNLECGRRVRLDPNTRFNSDEITKMKIISDDM